MCTKGGRVTERGWEPQHVPGKEEEINGVVEEEDGDDDNVDVDDE